MGFYTFGRKAKQRENQAKMSETIDEMRHSLKHNLLKNVLIRIDYTGITNIDKWVEAFQPKMLEYFSMYNRGVQKNARVNLTNLEDIAENLSIPIEEIRKETIHEFSGWKMDKNIVTMAISPYFMTINVRCNEYKLIDPFLDLSALFLHEMYEENVYFDIHRIGIRKVNGNAFNSIEEISKIYKEELFFGTDVDKDRNLPLQREYSYRYVLKDLSMKVNYTRQYRFLRSLDGNEKHQVLLDIDTYVDKACINQRKYNLKSQTEDILKMINTHQFEIFEESVQEAYINNKVDI